MLEPLFESDKKEKILFYLYSHGEGYAREIARTFRFNLNTVQNQLQNLEDHGILFSQMKGKVRIFRFNPRYPFRGELMALLRKAMMYLPEEEVRKYYWPRVLSVEPETSAHKHDLSSENPAQGQSLQEGISLALANPWEKSRLDRFMSLRPVSGRKSLTKPDGSEEND